MRVEVGSKGVSPGRKVLSYVVNVRVSIEIQTQDHTHPLQLTIPSLASLL